MQTQKIHLGIIGGLGRMASPMATHWTRAGLAVQARVLDRGTVDTAVGDERREKARDQWMRLGASLVRDIPSLIGKGDLDGVLICAGKNGDDLGILKSIVPLLSKSKTPSGQQPFLCHLSTISTRFARAAEKYCRQHSVSYINTPLTGGALGAERGTLLILGGGEAALFDRLLPVLRPLGNPRYFGSRVTSGAEVKFMGHLMVFNGLWGICSAVAAHTECFQQGQLRGPEQGDFFDYLNAGAGGTRQWDLVLSGGVRNDLWTSPFLLKHAVIDALYTVEFCEEAGVSAFVSEAVLTVALAFSYVLNQTREELASHSIVKEMIQATAREFDAFLLKHSAPRGDIQRGRALCLQSLPKAIRDSALLGIGDSAF